MHDDIEEVLFSTEQILSGIIRVADELTRDYGGDDFVVVGVLKGSVVFVADLVRNIPAKLEMAFVGASSYGAGTTSGDLKLNFFPMDEEIRGRRVLLVDDILDTGRTMSRLKKEMYERGASDVKTCVFLDKPSRRAVDMEADYACFEVKDLFVVGYGLDYAGRYRNLPYVGALKPEHYADLNSALVEEHEDETASCGS
ncbi:MAG: hypoxanthine phosphoribosyltransferase [Planctomycetota bacterium]|nr:hypoxanthine phosphoribosyltransferase [Planctomycetota bacterium]MDG2142971.1 hypoxanthine phosphoribosyltransferase [Planctomycetota bacterium]